MDVNRNPDIQRLLASLRNATTGNATANNHDHDRDDVARRAMGNSAISNNLPGLNLVHEPTPTLRGHNIITPVKETTASSSSHSVPQELSRKSEAPVIPDASTITTWPAAMKHVTKYVISNDKVATRIKYLMTEQQKHEQQWWAGREAIVARHNGRLGNQQKAAELLKSLGGLSRPLTPLNQAEEKAELTAYDRKVYKGTVDMAADFDKQLRMMGVPLFAIRHDLVIMEHGKESENSKKGRIDTGELRELQKKMVQVLEDLLCDD